MLKQKQYFRIFMNFQKFAMADKSNKSNTLAMVILGLIRFNYNGVSKKKFIAASKTTASNFARDTAELRALGFIKVIDHEIFVNPSMCWSGSDRNKPYRQKCFDLGVRELDVEELIDPEEIQSWHESSEAEIFHKSPKSLQKHLVSKNKAEKLQKTELILA
jgi:hypothetical protein